MEMEAGIPLGLMPDATYEQTTFDVGDGVLTLLSDGVVEARNSKGDLLGFERTRALSVKPAAEVADAAQAFGQDDDITVLTVSRSFVCA